MSARPLFLPVASAVTKIVPTRVPIRGPPSCRASSFSRTHYPSLNICKGEFAMEMRLLTTEREREIFSQRLAEARAKHGASFRDVDRTRVHNRLRLAASNVYGLFETQSGPRDWMVAGAVIHDLEAFPQSCHQPDLSHLPPRAVLE